MDPNWPGATPVPERGTESVGLLAFELMVSVPLAAPAAVGVNTALNVALWPALMVIGGVWPVKLNPVPDATAFEIVTLSPPVLVTITGTV